MTTSATGGYLAAELPVDGGLDLDLIWQGFVVGVTGMRGDLVRPRFQPIVPKMPEVGSDWAAVGVIDDTPDASPALIHRPATDGMGETYSVRHSELHIIVCFYGDNAHANAQRLRDGAGIPQNHDRLKRHGMGLVSCSSIISMPELVAQQWMRRCDVHITARKMTTQRYAIKHIAAAKTNVTGG